MKHFDNQEALDDAFWALLERPPSLRESWIEKTHSGGYRLAVKLSEAPGFTNFALSLGGAHVGEVLGAGRFTVLAPTVGPSGNPYVCLKRAEPVKVESLEAIGIYPHSKAKQQPKLAPRGDDLIDLREVKKQQARDGGAISLIDLGNEASLRVLAGQTIQEGDRSGSLTTAIKEWAGWLNWCNQQGIAVSGSVEDLAVQAGKALSIDSDRVGRILATVNMAACKPAALLRGGEESCWKKIWRLDRAVWDECCPEAYKTAPKAANGKVEVSDRGDRTSTELPTLADELRVLLDQNLLSSELKNEILDIARRHNSTPARVWDVYRTLENESDSDIDLRHNKLTLDVLDTIANTDPSACVFIDSRVGNRIDRYAELVGVSSMAIFATLLSAVASVAPGASRLELCKERELYARECFGRWLWLDRAREKRPLSPSSRGRSIRCSQRNGIDIRMT